MRVSVVWSLCRTIVPNESAVRGEVKGEKYMSQRVDGDLKGKDLWGSCIKEIDNKKRIWVPLLENGEEAERIQKVQWIVTSFFFMLQAAHPQPLKGALSSFCLDVHSHYAFPCRLAYLSDYFQALFLASCQRLHRTAVRCKDTDFFKILSGASVLASWRTYA